ncbi:isoprenylcysteine carboxylmethyltransferase family protein [Polaribacter vadi]|uniref:methyltransferase family protein n=1 Tax=Polaribacter TaxID=52959 RepID=UPI001C095E76|nr:MULTISPECIES: isoprenylcysteine carboxylmethyltransferase family protein [Polaribacter]MBU3012871.1 isoprenylcysteine carboxylmethyltransferase family protein [Polaribacter vadi]MDO6742687.1 isoprenylcysteine carboxylmethyltransferase family protein [Polaribacter sp. 1_MG-2023]
MLLFIFFIVYFLFVFVIRSFLLKIKTGVNPLTFNKTDDAHGYNGKVFTVISFLELVIVGIYAFKIEWSKYLLPFWYLENEILFKIGWGFLIISLIVVWFAQSQMANSWRIGIDKKNKTKLVTKGLFSISRNPIFLGIMLANIGLFLIIPNAFTLLIISLSTISINTQIRLEEDFLKLEFGNDYLKYSKKVRRWI